MEIWHGDHIPLVPSMTQSLPNPMNFIFCTGCRGKPSPRAAAVAAKKSLAHTQAEEHAEKTGMVMSGSLGDIRGLIHSSSLAHVSTSFSFAGMGSPKSGEIYSYHSGWFSPAQKSPGRGGFGKGGFSPLSPFRRTVSLGSAGSHGGYYHPRGTLGSLHDAPELGSFSPLMGRGSAGGSRRSLDSASAGGTPRKEGIGMLPGVVGMKGSDSEGSFGGTPRKKGSLATLREGPPGSEEVLEEGLEVAGPPAAAEAMAGEQEGKSSNSSSGSSSRAAKRQLWGEGDGKSGLDATAAPFGYKGAAASISGKEAFEFHRSITAPAASLLEAAAAAAEGAGGEYLQQEGSKFDESGNAFARSPTGLAADLHARLQLVEEEEVVREAELQDAVRGRGQGNDASRGEQDNDMGSTQGGRLGDDGRVDVVAEKLKQLPGLAAPTPAAAAAAVAAKGVEVVGGVKGDRVAMRELSLMALGGDARVMRLEAYEMISMWREQQQQP